MDVLDFLRKKPFNSFVFFLSRKDRYPVMLKPIMFALQNKILIVHGFFRGYFNIKESLQLVLPAKFKSESLKVKFSKYTIAEITLAAKEHIKDFINKDGSINVYGKPFYSSQENFGELIDLLSQVFVLDQYEAREYLKDGSVVIDAGANIGSFSVFAFNLKDRLNIYSFEPVKKTFDILKKNTSTYKNITCYNLGLGDVISRKKIFFSKEATVGSAFRSEGLSDELSEDVQITTIDSFVRENKLSKVDFIKIDTEGYEANILQGAKETIKKFTPVISMSAYHKDEDNVVLPKIIKSINPNYDYKLLVAAETDIIFFPKK